jgi:hypothetical protein
LLLWSAGLSNIFLGSAGVAVFWDSIGLADGLDLTAVFTVWGVALGAGWTFKSGLAAAWAGAGIFFVRAFTICLLREAAGK